MRKVISAPGKKRSNDTIDNETNSHSRSNYHTDYQWSILMVVAKTIPMRHTILIPVSGRIAVTFSGGYETESVDHGRPVKLIAGALNVPSKVFREAFSHVNPAPAGGHPSHERVRENKNVLMKALGPHGITNDRLDEVSNYYRYNRSRGEMWHVKQATAYAIVKEGMITHIEVTHGGSGYNSPPSASIPNFPSIKPVVQLSFDRQFEKNGSVKLIDVK